MDDLVKELDELAIHMMSPLAQDTVTRAAREIERLQAELVDTTKRWEALCDSYAEENQQFYDKIERLRNVPAVLRERFWGCAHTDMVGDEDRIQGYLEALKEVEQEMLASSHVR